MSETVFEERLLMIIYGFSYGRGKNQDEEYPLRIHGAIKNHVGGVTDRIYGLEDVEALGKYLRFLTNISRETLPIATAASMYSIPNHLAAQISSHKESRLYGTRSLKLSSGGHQYSIYHVSEGKRGTSKTLSVFYAPFEDFTHGNKTKGTILAIACHDEKANARYLIGWKNPAWDYSGNTISL